MATKRELWEQAKEATNAAGREAAKADGAGDDAAYRLHMEQYHKLNEARRKAFNDYMASDEP